MVVPDSGGGVVSDSCAVVVTYSGGGVVSDICAVVVAYGGVAGWLLTVVWRLPTVVRWLLTKVVW